MSKRSILLLAAIAATSATLVGCETGAAIVTGKIHPAIKPSEVKVYARPPHAFEEIAIVSAEARSGWTQQAKMDSALANARKKAAELGANGLLIESAGVQESGAVIVPSGNSLLMVPANTQAIKARAIYVTQE